MFPALCLCPHWLEWFTSFLHRFTFDSVFVGMVNNKMLLIKEESAKKNLILSKCLCYHLISWIRFQVRKKRLLCMCHLTRQKSRSLFCTLLYDRVRFGSRNRLTLVVSPLLLLIILPMYLLYRFCRTPARLGFLTSPCACISGCIIFLVSRFCFETSGYLYLYYNP